MLVTSIAFDRHGDLWFTEYLAGDGTVCDHSDAGTARRWNGFPAWPIGRGPHAVDLRYSGEAPIRAALVVALLGIVLAATLAAWPERRGAQPM